MQLADLYIATMQFAGMHRVMEDLRKRGKYTDMTISAQGRDIPVHKAIVCSQSPVLAAALNNGFKETHTSRIDLPEDYDTIRCLLDFCYLQAYNRDLGVRGSISQDIKLYVAADKYGVVSLKECTRAQIVYWLSSRWWPALNPDIYPEIVRDIWYAVPPDEKEFRDLVIRAIERNLRFFLRAEPGRRFLTKTPELPISILKHVNDGTAQVNANALCVIL